MEANLKISIGTPTYDGFKTETVLCLIMALRELNHEVHLNFRKGTYVHEARNQIVKEAQINGATHLMFIDADIAFPKDGIKRLLSHHKDIVGGIYNLKSFPLTTTLKLVDKAGNLTKSSTEKIPKKLFKCHALGTGFLLINMSVFEKVKKPYFDFNTYHGEFMGEDINFCNKAHDAGFDIWCDPTIRLGHIGDYLY